MTLLADRQPRQRGHAGGPAAAGVAALSDQAGYAYRIIEQVPPLGAGRIPSLHLEGDGVLAGWYGLARRDVTDADRPVVVIPADRDCACVEAPAGPWPAELLSTLRLGRRLVAEVHAASGRRAFVDITPTTDERDRLAEREGWHRTGHDRAFRVQHRDYDEQMIDGWDDVGAQLVRSATAGSEAALLELIVDWGLRPTDFADPHNTADPR